MDGSIFFDEKNLKVIEYFIGKEEEGVLKKKGRKRVNE